MDNSSIFPDPHFPEPGPEHASDSEAEPPRTSSKEDVAFPLTRVNPELSPAIDSSFGGTSATEEYKREESRRRNFLHNLYYLLGLTFAAFTLTAWILIRVDSPFGVFSSGPQEIVRAQLFALDRGELRPAYDMFSARYRREVSFDVWHQVIVTHWRMFHGEIVRSEVPAHAGPGVSLEIFLHGEDERDYRARFTLVHSGGRWWIDDVHWTVEPEEREVSRT